MNSFLLSSSPININHYTQQTTYLAFFFLLSPTIPFCVYPQPISSFLLSKYFFSFFFFIQSSSSISSFSLPPLSKKNHVTLSRIICYEYIVFFFFTYIICLQISTSPPYFQITIYPNTFLSSTRQTHTTSSHTYSH